ncbi:hypothetical protein DFH09DRAFT_1281394 [Mycena vulgaris]|nr:hypothetical protein DFH09DRAFT_1281394 [Mycena vulgaris]
MQCGAIETVYVLAYGLQRRDELQASGRSTSLAEHINHAPRDPGGLQDIAKGSKASPPQSPMDSEFAGFHSRRSSPPDGALPAPPRAHAACPPRPRSSTPPETRCTPRHVEPQRQATAHRRFCSFPGIHAPSSAVPRIHAFETPTVRLIKEECKPDPNRRWIGRMHGVRLQERLGIARLQRYDCDWLSSSPVRAPHQREPHTSTAQSSYALLPCLCARKRRLVLIRGPGHAGHSLQPLPTRAWSSFRAPNLQIDRAPTGVLICLWHYSGVVAGSLHTIERSDGLHTSSSSIGSATWDLSRFIRCTCESATPVGRPLDPLGEGDSVGLLYMHNSVAAVPPREWRTPIDSQSRRCGGGLRPPKGRDVIEYDHHLYVSPPCPAGLRQAKQQWVTTTRAWWITAPSFATPIHTLSVSPTGIIVNRCRIQQAAEWRRKGRVAQESDKHSLRSSEEAAVSAGRAGSAGLTKHGHTAASSFCTTTKLGPGDRQTPEIYPVYCRGGFIHGERGNHPMDDPSQALDQTTPANLSWTRQSPSLASAQLNRRRLSDDTFWPPAPPEGMPARIRIRDALTALDGCAASKE